MARNGKRLKAIREQLEPGKVYELEEALKLLTSTSKLKFQESVDAAIRLGVDPKQVGSERSRFQSAAQRHRQDRARRGVHPG